MQNFTYKIAIILFFAISLGYAQQEKGIYGTENWLSNWTDFQPEKEEYDEPTVILRGNISEDTTLKKREVYLLNGSVFVTNNAVLTIEPGTVILGDFDTKGSLTITKGASIIADGVETDPIIFSSNRGVKRAGDWGGLMILGEAPTSNYGNGAMSTFHNNISSESYANLVYGGENINSTSGIMKFVRVEYAGKRNREEGYSNGILLAGVGKETILENIMVSFSGGDSFEIWGGNVILERLISYKANGNDFHFNYGTQGDLKNSLAVRSPYVSDRNGSRALAIKSYDKREEFDFSKKLTSLNAHNLTILNQTDKLKEEIEMGLISEGVYVGKDVSLNMQKGVISGFNPAVKFEKGMQPTQQSLEKIRFTSMYFNNCNGNIYIDNNPNNDDLENWYGNRAFYNVYSKSPNFETFINITDEKRPDYRLRINRIITANDKEIDD
ncbi:hypothetical protein SAMN03097699_1205 [Flavobacteriaceae bacterium MAR_2010_188]|nr:hypothetical protein SAMN03097699_1205 [Flavobacteriaceae bacterium MAR_2010_188]